MAVAFTSLSSWQHAQDTTAAQEIVLAYSERRQCVGDSAIDALEAGDVKQDTTFWRGVQDWIETNCVKWVDDANFSTSTEYDSPADIAYTLATFRSEAGLETDGFRRATEWPTDWTNPADAAYSFGKITRGDIVGPWIFEDLQKAFDAMRWTFLGGNTADDAGMYKWVNATGYADALNRWPTGWSSAPYTYPYHVWSNLHYDGPSSAWRQYRDMNASGIATHIPHSADCYYWIYPNDFLDIDGLGMAANTFYFVRFLASDSIDERICEKIATIATMPEYFRASAYQWIGEGRTIWTAGIFILKWSFTNTL